VLLTAQETERLFGLDPQLIFDAIILAINIFILFLLFSYLMFNPVRDLLKKRQDKITQEREGAEADRIEAAAMKEEYETKLREADKEVEQILSEARKKAVKKEEDIINNAKEEAARIIARAEHEITLEKKRALDDVKTEMIDIASMMAAKVVAANMDTSISDKLVEETLKEMGDDTWRS
jgi:F-type H+-transporting ATPase subunit b